MEVIRLSLSNQNPSLIVPNGIQNDQLLLANVTIHNTNQRRTIKPVQRAGVDLAELQRCREKVLDADIVDTGLERRAYLVWVIDQAEWAGCWGVIMQGRLDEFDSSTTLTPQTLLYKMASCQD